MKALKKGVDYIGVTCVFYCHDGKGNFLLHKRSKHCRDEQGRWDCGGGSMEVGETFKKAVIREIKEEYGTKPLELKFAGVNNILRQNGSEKTHWVAVIFTARLDPNKVKIGEPKKIDELGWFKSGEFPKPLHSILLRHFKLAEKVLISGGV